jgi:hypothetical protein
MQLLIINGTVFQTMCACKFTFPLVYFILQDDMAWGRWESSFRCRARHCGLHDPAHVGTAGDPEALQTVQCWRLADKDGITHITSYLVTDSQKYLLLNCTSEKWLHETAEKLTKVSFYLTTSHEAEPWLLRRSETRLQSHVGNVVD